MNYFQLVTFLLCLAGCLAIQVRYIVVSPHTIRPGMVYNVVSMVTHDELREVSIFASVLRDGQVVAASSSTINTNAITTLPLKIDMLTPTGNYTFHVEGRSQNMVLFHNISKLTCDTRFLSLVIQTSKPLYRAGQEVRFRIVALHTNLRPFNDGLEVYVLDPEGLVMRRWISTYTNNGVSSLKMKLPKLAKDGYWKIRVKAWNQVEEHLIKVETYFDPLFEVHVKLPTYIVESEEILTGSVVGLYTNQRIVRGNGTLKISARRWVNNDSFVTLMEEKIFFKGEEHQINILLDDVKEKFGTLEKVELKVLVTITELLSRETVEGFSHSRIIGGKLQVLFLSPSPAVFKPGMPFFSHVAVTYEDKEKLSSDTLMKSRLRIQIEIILKSGQTIKLPDIVAGRGFDDSLDEENTVEMDLKEKFVDRLSHDYFIIDGVLRLNFETNKNSDKIKIKASFMIEDGESAEAYIEAIPYFSIENKYINVFSSSTNVQMDEYAILHLKANFILDSFQYIVVSKNEIVSSGEQRFENSSKTSVTLPLSVSLEMAPGFHFVVFHIADDGQILSDSCFLPVDGFTKYNTELEVNTGKDHKSERVEVRASGGEGAFIGIHAVRASVYNIQAGNDITLSRMVDKLMLFENKTRVFNKIKWKSRDGSSADKVQYFMSMNAGYDSSQTFSDVGLNILTSEDIHISAGLGVCDSNLELPCDAHSCYPANKTCDNEPDCASGYDEIMCANSEYSDFDYKISRNSRNEFLFDSKESDWAWREIKVNDHEGIEFEPMTAPSTGDDWYFTAFSINTAQGFSMILEPIIFSSKRNLMMHLTGPVSCFTGEQLALQVELLNNMPLETLVVITLKDSADYKFVHVEEGGGVSSYTARLSSGDHQLLVYLGPESQGHIDIPVTPTVEQGTIDVTVIATAQTGLVEKIHTVTVKGGGALINKHTAVFLDLKSRALVMSYMDIVVEESPIIPYSINRRYIYGSTSATVDIFGDIIGPAFSTVPATIESTLKTSAKGTLARVFEFGINIWTLHYLRLTNKLLRPFLKEVLHECNSIYAQILKRFNSKTGSFSNWDSSGFSVWLTAWALRLLKAATYPDWEFLLYVDPSVAERGVAWLLEFQATNGSFYDPSPSLDSKMNSKTQHIPLTAHVLIALCECMVLLSGELKTKVAIASHRAATYLEQRLSTLSDPYQLSVSIYALSVSLGRGDIEHAYHALLQMRRQNIDGFIYWSSTEIPSNPVKKENQRPYVKPRLYHEQDSVAVETTAWVLLIILHREGVTDTSERIVQWLNSMRMTTGGFISVLDTLVGLQALTEYAFRARLHEITRMDVTVEFPMSEDKKQRVHIDNSSLLLHANFKVPKVWGNVIVVARGAGQAIVQMDVNYGVDLDSFLEAPTFPAFDLNVTEYYSPLRNNSAITVQTCFRWLRQEPTSSSAAALEIDSPTGYRLVESTAESIAQRGAHPTLRDALVTPTKTIWFFEKIDRDWSCFNYTLRRWFPVANMSLHRQALLYETTARERFVHILVNSTPLHILNICEVCGSYQCPYCPYYNSAFNQSRDLFIYLYLFTMCLHFI